MEDGSLRGVRARVALKSLLGAAASELELLARRAEDLEAVIGVHVGFGGRDTRAIEDAQSLDYLTQHLTALADVLAAAAKATPEAVETDFDVVLAAAALSGLAARLAGASPPPTPEPGGDLELF